MLLPPLLSSYRTYILPGKYSITPNYCNKKPRRVKPGSDFAKNKKGPRLGLRCTIKKALYPPGAKPRRLRVTLLPAPGGRDSNISQLFSQNVFQFYHHYGAVQPSCSIVHSVLVFLLSHFFLPLHIFKLLTPDVFHFFIIQNLFPRTKKRFFGTWNPNRNYYLLETSSQEALSSVTCLKICLNPLFRERHVLLAVSRFGSS